MRTSDAASGGTLRILLIDDDRDDRTLVARQLEREFRGVQVEQIVEAQGFEQALEKGDFALVITDYQLRWTDGLAVLRAVKTRWEDCPVVMFTGTGSEEVAVEAMKAGLDDYVLKSPRHFVRLPLAVRSALDRSRQRRAVKESEARYWRLFDGLPIGLYLTTPEGKFIDANPALAQMLGYHDREAFLDADLAELYIDASDRQRWKQLMEREGIVRDFEVRLRRRDGAIIWARDTARAEFDADGRVRYYEGSLEDITERKRAEERLRLLGSAVHHAEDSIVITTAGGGSPGPRVVFVNPAFTKLTGYEERDVLGKSPALLRGPGEDLAALRSLGEALLRGETRRGETVGRRKDGRHFDREWYVTPLRDEAGRITHFVSTQRDVTERKAIAEQLRRSQKMEALGRLAGGIAHDFNNLLTIIAGYGDALREGARTDPRLRLSVEAVMEAVDKAIALTRQLLAFGRKQVLEPRVQDLNAIVRDVERMLRRTLGSDVRLVTELDTPLGCVRVDGGQIAQVIVNLSINARDAMPRGGTLRVASKAVELDERYARQHPDVIPGRYALLSVSDTGHGMDAATLDLIFDPFFTTKQEGKGTGLGLSTVYGIVRQSDGHITVRSKPGRGTTFEIYLPIAEGPAVAVEVQPQAGPPPGGSETILLVEDEEVIREMLRDILGRSGYTVLAEGGGDAAIEAARRHAGPIHLLLSDVVMPGIGARELARRVGAAREGVKVLFLSGHTPEEIGRRGIDAGEVPFLQKPFSPSVLLRKVREVLDS